MSSRVDSASRKRRTGRAAFGVAALAAAMSAGVLASASADAAATVPSHFVVNGSSATVGGDTTFINNGATNGQPGDLLFVSQNWDANGVCGCVYDSSPVGVWYDSGNQKWGVFREDTGTMPAAASFSVLAVPRSSVSAFVHRATAANNLRDFTLINNPLTNNNPNAQLQVTQNWNPGGSGGVYNNHSVGVWYDRFAHEWGIFNEDRSTMVAGPSFNVLVGTARSNGGSSTVVKASSSNILGDGVRMSSSNTDGDPNAVVLTTPNWNPGGVGGTYESAAPGVYFDGSGIDVFNEDTSTMPVGAAFNALSFSS